MYPVSHVEAQWVRFKISRPIAVPSVVRKPAPNDRNSVFCGKGTPCSSSRGVSVSPHRKPTDFFTFTP